MIIVKKILKRRCYGIFKIETLFRRIYLDLNGYEMFAVYQLEWEKSPYGTEHINRFGIFQLEMEKLAAEIEFDLVKQASPAEI